MPKKKTQEEFVNELKETHPNLTVLGTYIGDKKYVEVRCNIHSHTFMTKPSFRKNLDGEEVLVFQTSGRGAYVGRIDVELEKTRGN